MIELALYISITLLGFALIINVARLIKGPSMPDRVLALDTLYINGLALIVTGTIFSGTKLSFEAALLISVLGFVSTVAVGKHLLHGDIID
jgi:multicomponent K+:H+ antiporter subunit F